MADNKLMNRYYPADFDPSKLLPVKAIRPKRAGGSRQLQIRMMLPFTMRCAHCGEYLYIATKFNSRCEKVPGTTDLGLNAYRFYGACKHCKGEFVFKTDPEHCDYVLESGGTRTYEAFKDADLAEAHVAKTKADAEGASESQALENKIYDTAAEMRRIEELGELRSINKREAKRNEVIGSAIERIARAALEEDGEDLIEDEERLLEEEFRALRKRANTGMAEDEPATSSSVSLAKKHSVDTVSSAAPTSKPVHVTAKKTTGLNLAGLGIKIKPKQ